MGKTKFLYYSIPSNLLYVLGMDEFLFFSVLVERECALNKREKGEWFRVPNIFFGLAFDAKEPKKLSGTMKTKIQRLRESLNEKGLIECELGNIKNACKYRIEWENVIKLSKINLERMILTDILFTEKLQKGVQKTSKKFPELEPYNNVVITDNIINNNNIILHNKKEESIDELYEKLPF